MLHSKSLTRSSSGTPINSAMACMGSSLATSRTNSPCPPSRAARTIRSARSSNVIRSAAMERGVNMRDTKPRS
ncbi:Uncharacterised protein [Mycobacteroides abscessus subsp. abscessus]|nr:Uncharacterised protein [Mycobacteroides abscessus subsp. abscessus]